MMDVVANARALMLNQTKKNNAPAWLLTEIAVNKGRELASHHQVDERLVVISLYLAHTIFETSVRSEHPLLSADFVKPYLDKWSVSFVEQEIILNAIRAHHGQEKTTSKIAEVVKNAECFKFVTLEGSLIWLHTLGLRQVSFQEAVTRVLQKMEDKYALLTFPDCIVQADVECEKIRDWFSAITVL